MPPNQTRRPLPLLLSPSFFYASRSQREKQMSTKQHFRVVSSSLSHFLGFNNYTLKRTEKNTFLLLIRFWKSSKSLVLPNSNWGDCIANFTCILFRTHAVQLKKNLATDFKNILKKTLSPTDNVLNYFFLFAVNIEQ